MSSTPKPADKPKGNTDKGTAGQAAPDDPPDEPKDETRADGESCRTDKQCKSAHCNNRVCCSGGECCVEAEDCAADKDGEGTECIKPSECQGRRGPVACRENRCVVSKGSNDDTACGTDIVAADCGLYADVSCTGEANQEAPACPTACDNDDQCDKAAYCERGRCVKDLDDGETCASDAQCASDSCSLGKCCHDGDCCETVADCPASYTVAAACDEPLTCQGSRGEARCTNGKCETEKFDDDSGCGWWTPSKLCGQTRRLACMGGADQREPVCGDGTCYVDTQCDNDDHCEGGKCTGDIANGESCDRDAVCASNHCNNGICCDGGICCKPGDSCDNSFLCVSPRECQGERYVNECMDFQCKPVETTDDDSVCWGQLIDACGTFADMRCSADREQDVADRQCIRFCGSSFQCDPGLECRGTYCALPPPPPPPDNGGGGRN